MSLLVIAPGPLATVQDLGRVGYREFGVPVSGAFDRGSMALANALIGNEDGHAVVEFTGFGGVFEAEATLAIALAGAPMAARVERLRGSDLALSVPQSTTLRPGDRLVLGASARGHRAYLAVGGGWRSTVTLGSRSSEAALRAGDRLPAEPGETPDRRPSPDLVPPLEDEVLRILDGPDAGRFAPGALLSRRFVVAALSDRMGLRLEGEPMEGPDESGRLSSPVAPGAVQVAGGRPIVLGPACGTMGGYPHVGQVLSADLDRLGQLRPGSPVRFRRVELAEARRIDLRHRSELSRRGLILRTAAADPLLS